MHIYKLQYIKANGKYYRPQESGIQDTSKAEVNFPVCLIKKLWFGRWQIDYFDEITQIYDKGGYSFGDEDKPNQRVILYPSGIEEIKYSI